TTRCGSRSTIKSCSALGLVSTVAKRCLPVSASYSQATVLNLPRSSANILIVRVSLSESLIEAPVRDDLVLKQLDFIQLTLAETRLHSFSAVRAHRCFRVTSNSMAT